MGLARREDYLLAVESANGVGSSSGTSESGSGSEVDSNASPEKTANESGSESEATGSHTVMEEVETKGGPDSMESLSESSNDDDGEDAKDCDQEETLESTAGEGGNDGTDSETDSDGQQTESSDEDAEDEEETGESGEEDSISEVHAGRADQGVPVYDRASSSYRLNGDRTNDSSAPGCSDHFSTSDADREDSSDSDSPMKDVDQAELSSGAEESEDDNNLSDVLEEIHEEAPTQSATLQTLFSMGKTTFSLFGPPAEVQEEPDRRDPQDRSHYPGDKAKPSRRQDRSPSPELPSLTDLFFFPRFSDPEHRSVIDFSAPATFVPTDDREEEMRFWKTRRKRMKQEIGLARSMAVDGRLKGGWRERWALGRRARSGRAVGT